MNITLEKYIKVLNAGFSLDILYLLKLIKDKVDITDAILLPKIGAVNQMLLRKQLITEDNQITMSGDELLSYIEDDENPKELVKKLKTNDFDKWWVTYPATNMFIYKNKTFKGTQSKRVKKLECKQLFNKYINEGFTADDIINATEYHFQMAKDLSFKKGENQVSFIANSYRYLNEKMFVPFIELYKKQTNKSTEIGSAVDI